MVEWANSKPWVQVLGANSRYKPTHAYDRYEANDSILEAATIQARTVIEGNIMDDQDTDFYEVKSAGNRLVVQIQNKSTALMPMAAVFDLMKNRLGDKSTSTAGADLEYSLDALPGGMYFVEVSGRSATVGAYAMTVK